MAEDDVVIKVEVQQAKSMADLKKEFKELNKELSATKEGTKEYQQALEKLGAVKDDIGDLRDTISALNPEGKVQAFSNVAGKLAGGFQAATGAAALFGAKSEELEKQLLKVQAATAFAQGIQSIVGLSDAFLVLKAAVLSLNPILLAVSAAVVAIGAAYLVWSENMSEAAKNDALLNAELERQENLQSNINDELERELNLKKAIGVTGSELSKAELNAEIQRYAALRTRQLLLQQIADKSDEQIEELKKLNKEEADSYNKILVLRLNTNKAVRDEEKKAEDEADKLRKERTDKEKLESDKRIANMQDFLKKRAEDEEQFRINSDVADYNASLKETEQARLFIEEQNKIKAAAREEDLLFNQAYEDGIKKQSEETAEARKKHEQEVSAANLQAQEGAFNAAKGLSDLYFQTQLNAARGNAAETLKIRKKQFEVEKAFSIARAVIDGIRSVQAALTLPPPAGPILAAANGILAAVNIAKIASTKFDGGSAATPSLPTTNTTVPTIPSQNQTSSQPVTRLNADGTQQTGGYMQAYVLEKDITEKQKRTGRIVKQGKF